MLILTLTKAIFSTQIMHDEVKKYYGEILVTSNDLQTDACCTDSNMPEFLKGPLSEIHDEVASKYYGCGLVAP